MTSRSVSPSSPIYSESEGHTYTPTPDFDSPPRKEPPRFRILRVDGVNATPQFEAAFPTHYDRCKQALLIVEQGSHPSTLPYEVRVDEYPWQVNWEFLEFVRSFCPPAFRKDHWFYDVSDMYDYDFSNSTHTSSAATTQPLTPPFPPNTTIASTSPPLLYGMLNDQSTLVGEGFMLDLPTNSSHYPQPGILKM